MTTTCPPAAAAAQPTGTPEATADSYPRSVLLYFYGEDEDDGDSSRPATDAQTTAAALTSTGHLMRVSFRFVPPPDVSCIVVGFPEASAKKENIRPVVLAAHEDSVLFQINFKEGYDDYTTDHFVYRAGAGAAGPAGPRPPTVSLLPPYYLAGKELEDHYWLSFGGTGQEGPVHRVLNHDATGLLRHGEDEFVVAELTMVDENGDDEKEPELLLLRSGKWSVHRPAVIHGADQDMEEILSSWQTRCVLPLRGGMLCWVDVSRGLLFYNVFDDETPELRFVPIPVNPCCGNVSVTGGGGALKFVNIFPRCCCGALGKTTCHHAYNIHTWILRVDDDMVWLKDAIVDSTEIWGLDAYKGLPRVLPVCSYASFDDPHIVCFALSECYVIQGGSLEEWFIMLDLRSKTLLSSCLRGDGGYGHSFGKNIFPSRVSDYFNPCPSSSSIHGSPSTMGNHLDVAAPSVEGLLVCNDRGIRDKEPVDPALQGADILAVFEEIPSYGLAHDEVLKAITILSRDTGRRFKTLLELPMSLRKDWLLMEINANET